MYCICDDNHWDLFSITVSFIKHIIFWNKNYFLIFQLFEVFIFGDIYNECQLINQFEDDVHIIYMLAAQENVHMDIHIYSTHTDIYRYM